MAAEVEAQRVEMPTQAVKRREEAEWFAPTTSWFCKKNKLDSDGSFLMFSQDNG